MNKIGVNLKIDVTQIDKARLYEGKKGKYLNATVFIDLDKTDEYGNSGMITQDVSKEERDRGIKGPILGNCKTIWRKDEGVHNTGINQARQAVQPASVNQGQAVGGKIKGAPAPQGLRPAPEQPYTAQPNTQYQPTDIVYDDDIPFS